MIPAQAAYGEVATWDEGVARKLCKLLEGLPVGEILKLASKTVGESNSTHIGRRAQRQKARVDIC